MVTTKKCLQHSLHNHGCTCPQVQRYTNEQNRVIRQLYTQLKFSSPERKAVRNVMYKRTAEIKTEQQAAEVYDEIVEFITQQIEAQEKREGAAGVNASPTTSKKNSVITPLGKRDKKRPLPENELGETDEDEPTAEEQIVRQLMAASQAAEQNVAESDEEKSEDDHRDDDFKDQDYSASKSYKKETKKYRKKPKIAKTTKTSTIARSTSSAPIFVSVDDTPSPPPLHEHIETMFSNKIQSLHMIWILQANKRGIISDVDADRLQFLPYNNQSPFFIITLFLALYEALKISNLELSKRKWQEDGATLFQELLDLIHRRRSLN